MPKHYQYLVDFYPDGIYNFFDCPMCNLITQSSIHYDLEDYLNKDSSFKCSKCDKHFKLVDCNKLKEACIQLIS